MKLSDSGIDESQLNSKRSLKSSTKATSKKKKGKKLKKSKDKKEDEEIKEMKKYPELKECYKKREKVEECFSKLQNFYNNLNEIDLESLITEKNIEYLQNLNPEENLRIDIILSKIYNKILSSEEFYKDYFSSEEENEEKIPLVLSLIEEPIKIIDGLMDCVLSLENFQLKENLLKLIKFIYINLKDDLEEKEEAHLKDLINELPNKFYSQNYLEIIKFKNEIYKNNNQLLKNIEEIDNLFFELGSYYEQLSCIELLLNDIETDENNDKINNYKSISIKDIKRKKKSKKKIKKIKDIKMIVMMMKMMREEIHLIKK